MLKKTTLLGLMVSSLLSVPVFASAGIQGALGNVSSTDAAALGQVGCRAYSVSGPDSGINVNQSGVNPGCLNNRCLRPYVTLGGFGDPGGYLCGGENTVTYNNDMDNQIFYEVVDGQVNSAACNHAAFYGVHGMVASNGTIENPQGDFRQSGCPGTTATNCFTRIDAAFADQTPMSNVNQGYQGAHTLGSVGGLSPVPVVRTAFPGSGCAAGEARLTWDEPETYAGAMKGGATSPVIGVRLYANNAACSACPNSSTGWVPVTPQSAFPLGGGANGVCVPVTGPTWYALTVRFKGPGNAPGSEIESGRVGSTGFVGAGSQCLAPTGTATRISNVWARYSGRGSVNVNWTTGTEGGIQSFYVTRGTSAEGPFTRVSESVVPLGDGHSYAVSNKVHAALGRVLYYSIEIVNSDGTSEHSAPTAVNLPAPKNRLGHQ